MNNEKQKLNKKGFTLVELLIVVSLIGILSGVIYGVLNPAGIQKKSRDAQRAADLKKVQTALELYYTDNRVYPKINVAGDWGKLSSLSSVLVPNYIQGMASDPTRSNTNDNCSQESDYMYRSNGSTYVIIAKMEVSSSANPSLCSSVAACSTYGCNICGAPCYAVQNPL